MNNQFKKYLIIFWSLFLGGLGMAALILWLISLGTFGKLPTFEELENPKSALATEVWSSDGALLGKYYSQNRSNAVFEDLPKNLVDALIATEDVRFYEHSGVDARGLGRVFVKTLLLSQGNAGGGSTITQQLAKNLFPRERLNKFRLVIRKLQEWIIAAKLEKCYTKDEILTMYLNTVEFSDNAFGIKSAARTYFNKSVKDLKPEESAVLVGMLKAPYYYNPRVNPNNARNRRNTVLAQMNKYQKINQTAFDSLSKKPLVLDFKSSSHVGGLAPYFREHLRLWLQKWCKENKKLDGTNYDIYKDGLKVYVTIDSRLQQYAEQAMQTHMKEVQQKFFTHWKDKDPWKEFPDELIRVTKQTDRYKIMAANGASKAEIDKAMNTKEKMKVFTWEGYKDTVMTPLDSLKYHRMFMENGFLATDAKTGEIRAWVGGINYEYFKYDHVTSTRQIGSTFKPFLYATAIDNGWSPCYEIYDLAVTFEDFNGWTPTNADGKFTGEKMNLKKCLALSQNSCSAFLMKQIGPQPVIDMARRLGITSHIDPYPSICLGTPDISLLEMVGAYTAFANSGVYSKPFFVTRIVDKNGNLVQEFPAEKTEALSEQTAYAMVELLRNVTTYGTGARLRGMYKIAADMGGKTGTTQNQSDGWFMGITPQLVAGSWAGCEDRFVRFRSLEMGQGARTAMPVWALFFQKVYEDKSLGYDINTRFASPSVPTTIEIDCNKYKQTNPQQLQKAPASDFDRF